MQRRKYLPVRISVAGAPITSDPAEPEQGSGSAVTVFSSVPLSNGAVWLRISQQKSELE